MVIGINAPNVLYVLLAMVRPESMLMITGAVAIEQFGYGFGFQAYMLFMIHVARGPYQTAHYAITTAFMALGMMIPGLFSGYIQEALGYQNFFVWVVLATIPGILLATRLPISADYGKRATEEA
jgi:PAT family beta-lactamase induction signal transducer AmpG